MERRWATMFVVPALLLMALVTLYPLSFALYLSLRQELPIFGISRFIGGENFAFLLHDPRFWNALGNTLYFSIVSVGFEIALGLAMALLLNVPGKGRGLARTVMLVPWAVPTVVSARMWGWMYNTDHGLLNYLLGMKINWLGSPWWAMNAAILMDVWKTTPFVALLLLGGLQLIPDDLYQAAVVDGAGKWHIFTRITLPLLRPILLVVLILRLLDAFRVFDAVYVLTGGGPANRTETLSIYAYKILFQTLQFGYGSALSITVFLCVGIVTLCFLPIVRRVTP